MSLPPRRPFRVTLRRTWANTAVRYLVVGGLAFLIDFGLLALLHEVIRIPLVISTPTAFLTSFALTYLLQRSITFDGRGGWTASAAKYTLLVAFNTVATTAFVTLVGSSDLPWEWGKIIAVASTTIWNYFAYRYWVFAGRR